MRAAHVMFNPVSGSYSARRADQILSLLRGAGIEPQPMLPASEQAAKAQVRALCQGEHRPLIIAVGGDGTINTVINGLEPQSATLGVIPLGTANVLARELGIRTIADAVARIAAGSVRPFSVGEVASSAGSRRFLLMAGIGIDGAVVGGVRSGEKRRLGKLAYLLSALRQLRDWDRSALTVSDGQRSVECHTAIIANAAHYGGPYIMAPTADIFAPTLAVVPLATFSRRGFARFALTLLLTGRAPQSAEPWQVGAGQLTIAGEKAIQIDGDDFGSGTITVSIIPDFNDLLV